MTDFPREAATEKLALDAALAWIDRYPARAPVVDVPLAEAAGLALAEDFLAPGARPAFDLALIDGYALRAEDTSGASGYNPLALTLVAQGAPIGAREAAPCRAGAALPVGADAVLPAAYAERFGAMLQVCEPIPRLSGVARRGESATMGGLILAAGRRLDSAQLAALASWGAQEVRCIRPPRIALAIAGAKPPGREALALALSTAIARDGGVAARADLASLPEDADAILVVGRSGWGGDDDAVERLQAADGEILHHGVALSPGGSAGFGRRRGAPVLLAPGDPYAALACYEIFAGRLIRRLAGYPSAFPGPVVRRRLASKIASQVGVAEFIPLVTRNGLAAPLTPSPADGVATLAAAEGYTLIAPGSEGLAEGAEIEMALLRWGGRS